ncbi:MAG: type II secretion system F family protein [Filomicrobium sp.]
MADAQTLFPLLAAVCAAAVVFVLLYPMFFADQQAEKRMATVTEKRSTKVAARNAAEVAANRRKQVSDSLKELDERQKQREKITLRLRLQRAGLKITPQSFWITSAISGIVCAVTVAMSFESTILTQIGAMVAGFVGMFGLPRWVLGQMTKRRQQKFLNGLANSLDVVVRGVKSGLPLNECLQIIAREAPEPICSEFQEVVEQQRVGIPLGEALDRLADRMPLPEVRFLTIVIAIQQQAGGNLSEALGNLAEVLRSRIRMAMKVKALSAEATASAAVLASLPPGVMAMVYMSSPDYIMPLFTTKMGHFFIAAGLFWMGCGVVVMNKMINFKY